MGLEEEVARITHALAGKELEKEKRFAYMNTLSVATFMLMGNDAYIAVQSIMRNETKSVHIGLALLGVKVKTLEYEPSKVMRINGHDVLERVNNALSSAIHGGDWETFVSEMDLLRQDSENDFESRSAKAGDSSLGGQGAKAGV